MTQSHDESTPQAPVTPGARLRGLLASGGLIVAPGVFDGLSAHLARRPEA
jgi:2-methylisocitrate lyase-like PEP mutase family enzyme